MGEIGLTPIKWFVIGTRWLSLSTHRVPHFIGRPEFDFFLGTNYRVISLEKNFGDLTNNN